MVYVIAAGVVFVVALAALGFKIVPQAETMIIERLGKYHRTLPTGINVIWPLLERPRAIDWRYVVEGVDGRTIRTTRAMARIDLRETVYDFPRQNVITRDNVVTEINALVYFQITDPRRAVYEIVNLPDAIEKLTQTTLRNVIGEMDLDETLSSRDTINSKLRAILDQATDKWGVKVNRVELQDINPPADIKNAMEKQMRAERDRRAVILAAEGEKRARILEAEGRQEAAVKEAEGARQAQILMAQGEAEARRKVAEAEADAIREITQSIAASSGNPSGYLIALRYIDALKEMVTGRDNKVVYLPYEATGVLGAVGGIGQLFDHAEKTGRTAQPPQIG